MSFITTNPNPYIVNVPELQGVLTSATGTNTTADTLTTLAQYIDSTTNAGSFNSIGSYNSGNVVVTSDLYLSNAGLYVNDSPVIVSNNTLNGNLFTAMTVNNVEVARFTSNGVGILTTTPTAALHVKGSVIFQSDTVSMNFVNSGGTTTSGLYYDNSPSSIVMTNTAGDVALDAYGGSVKLRTDADLVLDGAGILAGAAGLPTGNYLRVNINGTFYKIGLFADV